MTAESRQWGGRREGAGRKSTWKSGTCKAVKLPVALVDQVLLYARQLDESAPPTSISPEAAAPERDWDLLERVIAEKAKLETRTQQLEQQLEKVVVSQQHRSKDLETRSEQWRLQNLDAQRILSEALRDQLKNKHVVRVGTVKQALDALGGYQDFPAQRSRAAAAAAAEEQQRLAELEAQNRDLARRLEAVAAAKMQLESELAAAREVLAAQEREPAGTAPTAGETDDAKDDTIYKAVILLRAGLERKSGIRSGDVSAAIMALTGTPDGSAAVELPPAGKGQLTQIVDGKLAAERKARHLESILAGERKQLRALTIAEQRAQARIADARSVLFSAYRERRTGVRKTITPAAVKSALLALGLDVDREAEPGSSLST